MILILLLLIIISIIKIVLFIIIKIKYISLHRDFYCTKLSRSSQLLFHCSLPFSSILSFYFSKTPKLDLHNLHMIVGNVKFNFFYIDRITNCVIFGIVKIKFDKFIIHDIL